MNKISVSTDAPGDDWCKVFDLTDEFEQQSSTILKKYKNLFSFDLWITFRCLPDSYNRKSRRRFWKADNALGLDISMSEETFNPLIDEEYHPLNLKEQRFLMGDYFIKFLKETIESYKKKLPELKKNGDDFIKDYEKLLIEKNWI